MAETEALGSIFTGVERRTAVIQGLRDLADYLDQRQDVPAPYSVHAGVALWTKEQLTKAARSMGGAHKDYSDKFFSLQRTFGPVTFEVFINREEVCEKTVIGTRVVPEHTEEIVQWNCVDVSLLNETALPELPEATLPAEVHL